MPGANDDGLFTVKGDLGDDEMWDFTTGVIRRLWPITRKAIAFNVMSKQVDWERDDLFHLPLDPLADFLTRSLSRHFVIRSDYGLYEYTVYVYRGPCVPAIGG